MPDATKSNTKCVWEGDEDIYTELKDGEIPNIKGEYKTEIPKQQPEELKGKFRTKKLDDINSRKVKRDEFIKAAKKTDEDELRKRY
jgi:hypothetical protein